MIKLYKLTDSCRKTWNDTQWGPGVSHSGTGKGPLCGPGWIHAYEHPLIAVLMNPIHAKFKNPRLWEAEGEIARRDGQLKCGCKTLTTVQELTMPSITTEMRVRFAILCAKEVCPASCLAWNAWADKWLSGEDRTKATALAAWAAARAAWAAAWAAEAAAEAAAWAAREDTMVTWAAARAAWAAAWAAEAAEAVAKAVAVGADIFAIAEKSCSGVRTFHPLHREKEMKGQNKQRLEP